MVNDGSFRKNLAGRLFLFFPYWLPPCLIVSEKKCDANSDVSRWEGTKVICFKRNQEVRIVGWFLPFALRDSEIWPVRQEESFLRDLCRVFSCFRGALCRLEKLRSVDHISDSRYSDDEREYGTERGGISETAEWIDGKSKYHKS